MALTITLVPDSRFNFGNFTGQLVKCVPAASDYATGGYAFAAAQAALRTLAFVQVNVSAASTAVTSAPFVLWDAIHAKLQAFLTGAVTPAGTVSAPTITTTTNAGTTEPVYTNGGALTQTTGATGITGVQAPTFTGSATTAALLAEAAADTDLSAYEFLCFCLGTP